MGASKTHFGEVVHMFLVKKNIKTFYTVLSCNFFIIWVKIAKSNA